MPTIKVCVVLGRRWKDSNGNTYNTVQIEGRTFDGEAFATVLPCEYGYGRTYVLRAEDWLKDQKLLRGTETLDWIQGPGRDGFLFEDVIDVTRRKDLHNNGR